MLCYEIWLNDNKLCQCGHEDMGTIQASLFYAEGMPSTHLTVSAVLKTTDKLKQDAKWASKFLETGDEVKLKIVECDSPEPPKELKPFGTRLHPSSKKELFCSFCGQSENKVEKMYEGMGGNICTECAKLCLE